MTEDELKKKIGNAKFEEIKTLVQKAKAEGKKTDDIIAMLRAKFKGDGDVADHVQTFIWVFIPPVKS